MPKKLTPFRKKRTRRRLAARYLGSERRRGSKWTTG
jgi:hypothetical protein